MSNRRRRAARLWLGVVLVGAAVTAGTTYVMAIRTGLERRDERLALTPDEGLEGLELSAFSMVDQNGRARGRDDLLGRLVVVDFLFTNCPFICPSLSANMRLLQERLAGVEGVRLVSVSVDPEHDTPDTLFAYGERVGVDPERWWLLSGPFEEARRISEEGFRLALTIDPVTRVPLGNGETMDNVVHSGKFVLVGPDGRVVTMVSGLDAGEVEGLAERVKRAARRLRDLNMRQ